MKHYDFGILFQVKLKKKISQPYFQVCSLDDSPYYFEFLFILYMHHCINNIPFRLFRCKKRCSSFIKGSMCMLLLRQIVVLRLKAVNIWMYV